MARFETDAHQINNALDEHRKALKIFNDNIRELLDDLKKPKPEPEPSIEPSDDTRSAAKFVVKFILVGMIIIGIMAGAWHLGG